MELHLDLTKSATRTTLLDELLALMSPEQRTRYDYILNHTTIPDKHHHSIGEINASIDAMTIDDALKENVRGVYAILAEAEANVHGCAIEETHFHEVGNASGIRNALAICTAFYVLAPTRITATPALEGELCTPTSAAIIKQYVQEFVV